MVVKSWFSVVKRIELNQFGRDPELSQLDPTVLHIQVHCMVFTIGVNGIISTIFKTKRHVVLFMDVGKC